MRKTCVSFKNALSYFVGVSFLIAILFLNQSCAVIAGGSKYYAHVVVEDHPTAAIKYQGQIKGYGMAMIKLPRQEANNLVLTISDKGCPTIHREYTERVFRGWSFVGTLVTWTGLTVNGGPWLPIPFGVIVDGATGAWWKPDIKEIGITKTDYKNYNYQIFYTECEKSAEKQDNSLESTDLEIEIMDSEE